MYSSRLILGRRTCKRMGYLRAEVYNGCYQTQNDLCAYRMANIQCVGCYNLYSNANAALSGKIRACDGFVVNFCSNSSGKDAVNVQKRSFPCSSLIVNFAFGHYRPKSVNLHQQKKHLLKLSFGYLFLYRSHRKPGRSQTDQSLNYHSLR